MTTLVGVFSAVSGAGIYRLFDLFVLKNRRQNADMAKELRDEVRSDNKALKERNAELQKTVEDVGKQRDEARNDLERYRLNVYKLLWTAVSTETLLTTCWHCS